jgi:hypothetical protein
MDTTKKTNTEEFKEETVRLARQTGLRSPAARGYSPTLAIRAEAASGKNFPR